MRRHHALAWSAAALAGCLILGLFAVIFDQLNPLDFERLRNTSTVVTDRTGLPLRIFTAHDGRWRLPTSPDNVSPRYLDLLLDIEDKRFWHHPGVDPLALLRAAGQLLSRGHVVSGGSTLTMQVVRLLEPRPRTFRSKLIEIARALQLEAHCSKTEILQAYLSLAPMGGSLEGLRAGSLAWFGKEPSQVSDAEAALLVLLPQNPNRLRPDRHPAAAVAGRSRLIHRAVADGVIGQDALSSILATPLPPMRHPMPVLAPHLAARLAAAAPPYAVIPTTLDGALQTSIESLLIQSLEDLPRPVTLAALVADWRSGEIRASVGNAAFGDARRLGAVDMTNASRSPGSTLKPFIYGLAFEGLLAHPGSLVRDAATRFDDYAPHNFDGTFNGDVTVRQALQWSLNLPAVLMLKRVGPVAFVERLKSAGIAIDFGDTTTAPGLPVALGGAGMTLTHLVEAYAGLAAGGRVQQLREQLGEPPSLPASIMAPAAADAVVDILSDMPPPPGTTGRAGRIAYKTGTSYRFRDGWAVGFNGSRVAGVWMGRADGGSCPGCVGAGAAALLFRLFDLMPPNPLPRRTLTPVFAGPPPAGLTRLDARVSMAMEDGPHITFPIAQSKLLADFGPGPEDNGTAIKLAASGGARPYRWLVDGQPVASQPFAHDAAWHPTEEGFSTVIVIDAAGRSDQAIVRVSARAEAQGIDLSRTPNLTTALHPE